MSPRYQSEIDLRSAPRGCPRTLARDALRVLVFSALAGVIACADPVTGETEFPPVSLVSAGPPTVVPGTKVQVVGDGFLPSEVGSLSASFEGELNARQVRLAAPVNRTDGSLLVVTLDNAWIEEALGGDGDSAEFSGRLVVTRTLKDGTASSAELPMSLGISRHLTPSLSSIAPVQWFPGDLLTAEGADFLHPGEGLSLVQFDGEIEQLSPPALIPINGLVIPAVPADDSQRNTLQWALTPDIFGIRPGRFTGTATALNQAADGTITTSAPLALDAIPLERPVVTEVSPTKASRGQQVTFTGRGLLPPDNLLEATSLLVLEGEFEPNRGPTLDLTGVNSLALFPDPSEDSTSVTVTLRVDIGVDGKPAGLGLNAGRFEGTVTPMLVFGDDSVRGDPLPLTLDVLPARQMVYLKFLPAFDEALDAFGLIEAKEDVITRVMEVVARDYANVNVVFVTTAPEDYAEFSIVEIGGRDPNGTKLFGLDNTAGKDVGNLRFDDVIGGFNAETSAGGFAAYGGIFPAEFLQMSAATGSGAAGSSRFDDIFGPVSPELGGTAATYNEVLGGGERAGTVAEAIRVFGNLVGNTVSHEVGHSLGLAATEGQFHNSGDGPNWIMDAGSFRPFEERGEVDGQGPQVFSPENRAYLEQILPTE